MSLWEDFTNAFAAWLKRPYFSISRSVAWTGYTKMRDVTTLFEAVCDVYDRSDFRPSPDGSTHCNQAVCAIAQAMGCQALNGKTADQILDLISESPEWSDVPFERAQDLANQGSLLIAGLKSKDLNDQHGHVVVIRPGKPCQSGKWGLTPRCVNIGKNDFLARAQSGPLVMMPVGLNDAFIPMPKIWVWRMSL